MIERYEHHGQTVAVQPKLKGKHRDHCLCYQGCAHFQPGQAGNCEIAEANLANCKRFGTVQPVWECPRFEYRVGIGATFAGGRTFEMPALAPGACRGPGPRDPESASPYGVGNGPLPDFAPQAVEVKDTAPRLIGLSGAAGSGKSTVAGFLEGWGYTRLRFADPLKAMLRALLVNLGLDPVEVARMVEGDLKEVAHPALSGKTPRHAMQTLGTEWGRTHLGLEFWVQATMRKAQAILDKGGRVVIEDCRFPNEASAIKGTEIDHLMGVRELWHVAGRQAALGTAATHDSERHARTLQPDLVLDNSRDLDALEALVLAEVLG